MFMAEIPVVIFCGGEGTRMRGGTLTKKELVEIGGRPIIWHVMRIFSAYGHNRFILPLGHEAAQIKNYFLNYEAMTSDFTVRVGRRRRHVTYHSDEAHPEWEVSLIDTGLNTDKASRIARVAPYLDADRFFLTYGDGLSDVDINTLLNFHLAHGRLATITAIQPAHYQYGVMEADQAGLVDRYEQYPGLPYWINGGFMIFEQAALDYMQGGDDLPLETGVLQEMIADRQVMMYRHDGFWASMDTLKDTLDLQRLWDDGAPWRVWGG
ncbi:MAG: sugar phosphate nucleotidyltransferase [Candidatus Promineifilaceae bacterium]